MKTSAEKSKAGETVFGKSRKKQHSPLDSAALSTSVSSPLSNFQIQRKASCACGGGCPVCQTKAGNLPVSHPGSAFEIEADQAADKVMRMSGGETAPLKPTESQPQFLSPGFAPIVRTKGRNGSPASGVSAVNKISSSGGRSMDGGTQSFMQSRFGADFSGVKIHTDSSAVQMSRELNAEAFTFGKDIFFNDGRYAPESDSGKRLLAHELAHTLQQSGMIHRQSSAENKAKAPEEPLHKLIRKEIAQTRAEMILPPPGWILVAEMLDNMGPSPIPGISPEFFYRTKQHFDLGFLNYFLKIPEKVLQQKLINHLIALSSVDYFWGYIKGLGKGIGSWFVDLYEMAKGLVGLVLEIPSLVRNAGNYIHNKLPFDLLAAYRKASNAATWLEKPENLKLIFNLATDLFASRESIMGEITTAVRGQAFNLAEKAGASTASKFLNLMGKSGAELGETFGKIVGYLLPEILLAVFSFGISSVVKGALQLIRGFIKIFRLGEIILPLIKMGRSAYEAVVKVLKGSKIFAGKAFAAMREMIESILEFFNKFLKYEEEKLTSGISKTVKSSADDIVKGETKVTKTLKNKPETKPVESVKSAAEKSADDITETKSVKELESKITEKKPDIPEKKPEIAETKPVQPTPEDVFNSLDEEGWFGKELKPFEDALPEGYKWSKTGTIVMKVRKKGYPRLTLKKGKLELFEDTRLSKQWVAKRNYLEQARKEIQEMYPKLSPEQVAHAAHELSGYEQLHHLMTNKAVRETALGKAALKGGYRIDDASNILGMPKTAELAKLLKRLGHLGDHPEYTEKLMKKMKEVETRLLKEHKKLNVDDIDDNVIQHEMKKLEKIFRELIEKGDVPTKGDMLGYTPSETQESEEETSMA